MTLWIVVGAVGAALGYFVVQRAQDLSGADARRLVENGALLVDVRTADEFAAGHLPGAVNLPVGDLQSRVDELAPKERPVVVYCRSGMRSGRAARILTDSGYVAVHNLGPMSRW